jgi:hypothetical protein
VDTSKLSRAELLGILAGLILVGSLFLEWFSLDTEGVQRDESDDWVCGTGDNSCTGFETFPILRWLLILAALAPAILAWILIRGHRLSWAPGEMTMVAGFAATVLIAYNGIIDRPGTGPAEIGVGLDYGYWVALLAAIVIAGTGFTRSLESGERKTRKAPGTV